MTRDEFVKARTAGVKRFVVQKGHNSDGNYREGDVLTSVNDDGTSCPFFFNERTGETKCIFLRRIESIVSIMETEEELKATIKEAKAKLCELSRLKELEEIKRIQTHINNFIEKDAYSNMNIGKQNAVLINKYLKEAIKIKEEK